MPPDSQMLIRQLIPENQKLSHAVVHVCNTVYKSKFLPIPLVRLIVTKGLYLARHDQLDPGSKAFHDALTRYAKAMRPRFRSKITNMNGKGI